MRIIKCLILFIIMSMLTCSKPLLEDSLSKFYVASNGDDNNPGTKDLPWKTLKPVNDHSFESGDTVFFGRGSSFSGGLFIKSSGNLDEPIVFTAYGSGPAPRFTNMNSSILNGNIIQILGSYIVIDGLYFHDGVPADTERDTGARDIGAVYIKQGADYNIIKNCEIMNCPIGVQCYGKHCLITKNHIHDCNRFLEYPNWGPIGIMVATSNNEISYNRIVNYKVSGGTFEADGGAIEIDNVEYPKRDIYIHHNYSSRNEGFLEIIGDVSTENIIISYNISDDYQEFIFFWSGRNCLVENNTVLCLRPKNSRVRVVFSFNEGNNIIRNNIFVLANGLQVFSGENVYGAEYYDQPHEHNIYYCVDGSQSDPCGKPLGEGDIVADPCFVSLEARDLHPESNSPAIDAGVDAGYSLDFEDNPVPVGDAPDIGAYEYQSE